MTTTSRNTEIITLSDKPHEDGHPFEAVILSGEPIAGVRRTDGSIRECFIVDFTTLEHPSRVVVNYNHNNEIIIGYGENFRPTQDGLMSTGKLVGGDAFRDHLINLAQIGVPFEASVEIDLDAATETLIGNNERVMVNGRSYTGPLAVYSHVPLKAYAMCPHGADKFTTFTLLKQEQNYIMSKKQTQQTTNLSAPAPTGESETPKVKDPDLAEFCDVYGREKGLDLWQSGADIADIRKLKELIEKYGVPSPPEPQPTEQNDTSAEPKTEPKEEPKAEPKKDETVTELHAAITALKAEVTKLHAAVPRGEQAPVSHNYQNDTQAQQKELSEKEKYLAGFNKSLAKK